MDAKSLFQEHHHQLLRYLTRFTGSREEAEDALQEAYLRLVERPPERDENARAWLFTVATNVVRDRHRSRHEQLLGDVERMVRQEGPDAHALLEQAELVRRVRRLLGRLSMKERTVLLMRAEGFRQREIAQAVGTTTRSVGTMVARALRKLGRELGEDPEEVI